jgi:hypothetical protein
MKRKNILSAAILSFLAVVMTISCNKDENQISTLPVCSLIAIKNSGDTLITSYTYNTENRPVKIQYFTGAVPDYYALYEYTSKSYNYRYFDKNDNLKSSYQNPLPFNSKGLTPFAYYVSQSEVSNRYDSVFYEYNTDNYKTKETRWIKFVYKNTGDILLGLNIIIYTYQNNNCIKSESFWDVGSVNFKYTFDYEYFYNQPNKKYNHTPWLGKLNANNLKKSIYTSFNQTTNMVAAITTTEYINELDDEGKVKKSTITSSSTLDGNTTSYTQVYKYNYECK